MATVILISNDILSRNSILGGNIDVDKLWPAVKACQKTLIKPLLTEELYNKISNDYLNDNLSGLYLEMYEDFIKDMIIYGAAGIYIGAGGAYQITNMGITKGRTDNSETISKNEVDYLYNFNKQLYEGVKEDFLKWIKDKDIPEYKKKCDSQRLLGGWLLKKRYKKWKD
jgi:hypothetical protein